MSFSDSLFFLEIVVEELKSFISCKEFYIKSKFADIFLLNLKDPNDSDPLLPKEKKSERKCARTTLTGKCPMEVKERSGQSVLFNSRITVLISSMKNFPIKVSLFNKDDPKYKLGSAQVPWSPVFIEYLYMVRAKRDTHPAQARNEYIVLNEFTSKCIATITLHIKLTYKRNRSTPFRFLSETTFTDPKLNSKPKSILTTIKETSPTTTNNANETCKPKAVYGIGKRKNKNMCRSAGNKKKIKEPMAIKEESKSSLTPPNIQEHLDESCYCKMKSSTLCLVKSDSDLCKKTNLNVDVIKRKSCSSLAPKHLNFLNYVFGDSNKKLFGNRVYCVSYFTVENDIDKASSSSKSTNSTKVSPQKSSTGSPTPASEPIPTAESKQKYTFKYCESDCPSRRKGDTSTGESECSLDLPKEVTEHVVVTKCKNVRCLGKPMRELPPPRDDSIRVDLSSMQKDCCAVEQIAGAGSMKAKMKYDDAGCFCSCECQFEFMKRTTYCGICGGYENVAPDDNVKKALDGKFPCPVFHKLLDKKKTLSNSGSDKSKSKADEGQKALKKNKSPTSGKPSASGESEKEGSSRKKRCKDRERFKFNHGYTAPKIGHIHCAAPCTGTLGAVPKNMGWLWTADNIPGLKFRPQWRPGATHKHVVRLLRLAKDPGIILAKKKKKPPPKKKPLNRPLLTVAKKDGEYTVTMETMKIYSKPRAPNQQPYEDKPLVTYTIGRTEEENRKRQKRKERELRRLDRDRREFIQSAFSDMCKEICVKTYKQALGLLPDAEDPDCVKICYPKHPGAEDTNLDRSCSCSEDNVSYGSDTDSDEWIVEFTPPNATYNPKHKPRRVVKVDNSTQYTYLDYRVKLLDRFGNEVPRFFKGPDGKTQCSDLGGFWGPDHKWLEINVDGYIGPDKKWAPMVFHGPNGEYVNCDNGKFHTANDKWLVVGVDGYVDANGNWKYYMKPKGQGKYGYGMGKGDRKDGKGTPYKSETSWSCFGDADPKDLSKMGILGHGHDKKILLKALKDMLDHGENVKIPEPSRVPRLGVVKKGGKRKQEPSESYDSYTYFSERERCRHPVPSDKGIVAIDRHGNKKYFKLKDFKNRRPHQRLTDLTKQGISLSSFHVPCFNSFINAEMLKMQQYNKYLREKGIEEVYDIKNATSVNASTQYKYRYTV